MQMTTTPLALAIALALLSGCGGGGSDNKISGSDDSSGGDDTSGVTSKTVDASDSSRYVYLNLDTGQMIDMTAAEAAASTAWHLAFSRTNIQLNGGASGPGNVVGAVGADQADFYDASGNPNASVFLNATANSELEHLLAAMSEPSSWTGDALTSLFGSDWYVYDFTNGNITENAGNGFLLRSAEGDSYARVRTTDFDFPTRTGDGIKNFEFSLNVQAAGTVQFAGPTLTFTGSIPATGGLACFDFDTDTTVNCETSDVWDLQIGFQGRDIILRSNSGPSGDGNGGVFGPFEWSDLSTYTSATSDPDSNNISARYTADASSGIFTTSSWYAYDLQGAHQLWPNYRVYLIDTDSTDAQAPVYALQVTSYYGASGGSGQPTIRWTTADLTATTTP